MKELIAFKSEKQIQTTSTNILEEIQATAIDSHPKYQRMTQLMQWCKMGQKFVDSYFEPIRQPAYDALQAVYAKIKQAKQGFVDGERLAKQRMGGWDQIQARKAAETTEKQTAQAEAKGFTPPPPVENKARTVEGVSYRENYEVEEVDRIEFLKAVVEGKLPGTMIQILAGEVKKFANATKGQIPIPGFKVFRRDIVVAR